MKISEFLSSHLGFIGFVLVILLGVILAVGLTVPGQYLMLYIILFACFYLLVKYVYFFNYYRALHNVTEDQGDFIELGKIHTYTWEQEFYLEIYRDLIDKYNSQANKFLVERGEYEEFVEGWVHEIKTPIAASKLIIENDPFDENLASIEEEIERIESFVEMVIFYAKKDSVHNDYQLKKHPLNSILRRAIVLNRNMLLNKDIDLVLEDLDMEVLTDKKWMGFIAIQIVQNAVKYSKPQGGQITIKGRKEDKHTYLEIEDNGIGIHEEDLSRVFNKGFTGENSRDCTNASGLGLYMAKQLCEKLGHEIVVASSLGEYTKVTVTFRENLGIYDLSKL